MNEYINILIQENESTLSLKTLENLTAKISIVAGMETSKLTEKEREIYNAVYIVEMISLYADAIKYYVSK